MCESQEEGQIADVEKQNDKQCIGSQGCAVQHDQEQPEQTPEHIASVRKLMLTIGGLNFGYFFVEFIVAVAIGSVSLFADSVDFLEDTAIAALVFLAVAWTLAKRRKVGSILAIVILIPGVAALWTAISHIINPVVPNAPTLTLTAVGALIVNVACALILARHRHGKGDLVRAAWLSARNDALSNILIIAAGFATSLWATAWFDIVAGLIIAFINVGAAKEVWEAAHAEEPEFEED